MRKAVAGEVSLGGAALILSEFEKNYVSFELKIVSSGSYQHLMQFTLHMKSILH